MAADDAPLRVQIGMHVELELIYDLGGCERLFVDIVKAPAQTSSCPAPCWAPGCWRT